MVIEPGERAHLQKLVRAEEYAVAVRQSFIDYLMGKYDLVEGISIDLNTGDILGAQSPVGGDEFPSP